MSNSNTLKIINTLKEKGEDAEWYPTTNEIIEDLYTDIRSEVTLIRNRRFGITLKSILDIGAGDGRVLSKLNKYEEGLEDESYPFKLFAIEKSQTLINEMDKDIIILGTDFYQQSLIDKKVDIIFCNPPYSDFSFWMEKIIKEANAKRLYFVVPTRWETQENIKASLEKRKADYSIIGDYDFLEGDRKARAKVQLIRVDLWIGNKYGSFRSDKDPFSIWFDEHFKIKADAYQSPNFEEKKVNLNELTTKKDLIPLLVESYNEDFQKLLNNYKALETIDPILLEELGVTLENIKEALKNKIEGLKYKYWDKLFENLDTITDRLTLKSRSKLLEKLTSQNKIDFTNSNAYSVVIWSIKNANQYYDDQLLDLYYDLSKKENIVLYKSNKRIINDEWRYARRKEMTHYSLDYRIVYHHYEAIDISYGSKYGYVNNLNRSAHEKIQDIITIAKNLGFDVETKSIDIEWYPGKKNFFYLKDETLFAEIKAFKNGNLHYKFNQKFMKKLNLEAARLNKWIKSPKEASEEFDITEEEAKEYFKGNFQLESNNMLLLE